MDAATRAELDALRLRAYGPSADIAGDAAGLERLIALEELALPAPPIAERDSAEAPAVRTARDGITPSPDTTPIAARVVEVVPAPARRTRRGWHVALVAAVAIATIPLGTAAAQQGLSVPEPAEAEVPESVREALAFTTDPGSEVLITVRIDGSFGDYVDLPVGDNVPLFPVEGLMTWVEPLGDYYGWKLWIGGARGAIDDENCMLLDGDGTMRANCVPVDLKSQGALLLSIPFAEIPASERPETMTAEQSLGFWWGDDGTVKILLAPTPTA